GHFLRSISSRFFRIFACHLLNRFLPPLYFKQLISIVNPLEGSLFSVPVCLIMRSRQSFLLL
ncbi:hypothetical protein CSUI_008115, partial [Cystoisospora suis]